VKDGSCVTYQQYIVPIVVIQHMLINLCFALKRDTSGTTK